MPIIISIFLLPIFVLFHNSAYPLDLNIEYKKLANGIKIYILPTHHKDIVIHSLWYNVGGADDLPNKSGIAHFLEHMMFHATKNHSDGEFTKIINEIGGITNAMTTYDYTTYYQVLPSTELEVVMQFESDRMRNLIIDDDIVEKERNIVTEERAYRLENNPKALLSEHMRHSLYGNHPYGRAVIGSRKDINSITKKDLQSFYDKFYQPNNAILLVAGDVEKDHVFDLANEHYGVIPKSEINNLKQPTVNSEPAKDLIEMIPKLGASPFWMKYYKINSEPSNYCKLYNQFDLLDQILSYSKSNLLYKNISIDKDLVTHIDVTSMYGNKGDILFGFAAIPKKSSGLDNINYAVGDFLKKLPDKLTEAMLNNAKYVMSANLSYAMDDLKGFTFSIGKFLVNNHYDCIKSWHDDIKNVDVNDIKYVISKLITSDYVVEGRIKNVSSIEN